MTAIARSHHPSPIPSAPFVSAGSPPPPRRSPLILAVTGLLVVAVSAAVLMTNLPGNAVRSGPANPATRPPAETPAPAVTVADLTYEPSHSSGWHVHPGVHSVVVLSGTLTIFDEACRRYDYGPGQTYVGGHQAHLARNLGSDATLLAVTYVPDPTAAPNPGTSVAAPAGCDAAA